MKEIHTPVLLKEVIEGLRVRQGKKYIDATFGGGGHGLEIARRGGVVLGIDKDPFVISRLKAQISKLQVKEEKLKVVCGNFANLREIAKKGNFRKVSGVLFDLGLCSWQIEESGRGFSYLKNEPLDMRYNPKKQRLTAAEILNQATKEELYEIFTKYSEELNSWAISDLIVKSRPLKTTADLGRVIEKIGGGPKVKARIFQALRIVVNEELENLRKALPQAVDLLESGGRLVVISFHSLEDRIVKEEFKESLKLKVKMITKKPIRASFSEIKKNPGARSAKLRIAEKI